MMENNNLPPISMDKHMGLVVFIAKKFKPKDYYQLDEFIQLGRIGLWKATKKFDPKRGTKFSTVAWRYITNEILREINKNNKYKEFTTDNFYNIETKNTPIDLWEYIPNSLSKEEKTVLQMRLENYTFVEISQLLGYSRSWSNGVFKRAIKKIQYVT